MRHTIDEIIPGDGAGETVSFRPIMRRFLRHQLTATQLRVRAMPGRCADPERALALLGRVAAAPKDRQDRFFDAVGPAAWIVRCRSDPAAMLDPAHLARLAGLVDLLEADRLPGAAHPVPLLFRCGDRHPALACVEAELERDTPGLAASACDPSDAAAQLRLVVDGIATVWPGMALMLAEHIRGVLLVSGREICSPSYTPGVVLIGEERVAGLSGEDLVHETVHQALFCLETETPLGNGARGADYVSEWSGRRLDRSVYGHIGCVYLVIAEYWRRYLALGVGETEKAARRLARLNDGLDAHFGRAVGRDWLSEPGRTLFDQARMRWRGERGGSGIDRAGIADLA